MSNDENFVGLSKSIEFLKLEGLKPEQEQSKFTAYAVCELNLSVVLPLVLRWVT